MAEVTEAIKERFQNYVSRWNSYQTLYHKKEEEFLQEFAQTGRKSAKLQAALTRVNITSFLLSQNMLFMSLSGRRHEKALNEARKSCYQSILHVTEVTNQYINAPLSDYLVYQNDLKLFDDIERFQLARKLLFTVDYLEIGYGENTKWKWSIADLMLRAIVAARNIMNIEEMGREFAPTKNGYQERVWHWQIVRQGLQHAALLCRNKYELVSRSINDLRAGIELLQALYRLLMLTGEREYAEKVKTQERVWKKKMEEDFQKKDST